MHLSDSELQRWLDGSLGRAGRERVRTHLDSCESCRERRNELAWLYQSLVEPAQSQQLTVPDDLIASVMAAVATEPIPKPNQWRVVALCVGVAIVAMVVGLYATVGGGMEGWQLWAVEVGRQLADLAQAAEGLWAALRVGVGVVGPIIAVATFTLVAGSALAGRLAWTFRKRQRLAAATVEEGNGQ